MLEHFCDTFFANAETNPDGKISISELGYWAEINSDMMTVFSNFEPPLEVEERNQLFLPLDRATNHIMLCGKLYLKNKLPNLAAEYKRSQIDRQFK